MLGTRDCRRKRMVKARFAVAPFSIQCTILYQQCTRLRKTQCKFRSAFFPVSSFSHDDRFPAGHVQSTSEVQDGFVKSPEQTFGKAHPTREKVKSSHRIVVKVASGTRQWPQARSKLEIAHDTFPFYAN